MNNKGQTLALSLLFAVMIFLVGILFLNFLEPEITTAYNALSCSDVANISAGTKLTCLFVDITSVYWIMAILSLAGGYVLDRLLI